MEEKTKKGLAALIIDTMPKSSKEDKGEEKKESSDYDLVAEELLSAIKQEDAAALSEALQSFVSMCGESELSEEDGEE